MSCNWSPIETPSSVDTKQKYKEYVNKEVARAVQNDVHPSNILMDKVSLDLKEKVSNENAKVLYNEIEKGSSPIQILNTIENQSYSSLYKSIANAIKNNPEIINGASIEVGNVDNGLGQYNSSERKITIKDGLNGWNLERVILHEMIHDLSLGVFRNSEGLTDSQKEFKNNIEKLYSEAKSRGVKGHGMINPEEFISESMTNPSFQKELSRKLVKPRETFLDRILNFINNLLGINRSYRNLSDIVDLTLDFINNNNVYKHNKKINGVILNAKDNFNYRDTFQNIESVDDFTSNILGSKINYDVDKKIKNQIKNRIDSGLKFKRYNIEITPDLDQSTIEDRTNQILEIEKANKNTASDISTWINNGADTSTNEFEYQEGKYRFGKLALSKFKRTINLKPNQKFYSLSDISSIPLNINPKILPNNMGSIMISVTDVGNNKKVDIISFSHYDGKDIIGDSTRNKNLLSNYFSSNEIKRFGATNMLNNKDGILKMNTLLLAKHIMAENENVIIDTVGINKMSSEDSVMHPVIVSDYDEMFNLFAEKHSESVKEMPELFQKIFNQKQTVKVDYNFKTYVNFLNELNESYLNDSSDPEVFINISNITKSKVDDYLQGRMTSRDIKEVLNARLKYINGLESKIGETTDGLEVEKKLLSKAIIEMNHVLKDPFSLGKISEGVRAMYKNIFDIRNSYLQYARDEMFTAQTVALNKTKKEINEEIRPLIEKLVKEKKISRVALLKDTYSEVYKNLFKDQVVKDVDGNDVIIKSRVLKHSKEDQKDLTQTEKDLIEALYKRIKENNIKQRIHFYESEYEFFENGTFQYDKAKEEATRYVENVINEYEVPVTYKRSSEMVMAGSFKQAFKNHLDTITNDGTLTEDFVFTEGGLEDVNNINHKNLKVTNYFNSQLGGNKTEEAYGLKVDENGNKVLVDKNLNDFVSWDIEGMIMKHTHFVNRKIQLEKDGIPAYLTAKNLFKDSSDMKINNKILEELKRRYIDGKRVDLSEAEKTFAKYVKPFSNILTKTGIAINPNTILSAGLMNFIGKARKAMSRDMDWFADYKSINLAKLEVAKNYKKAKKIAESLQQLRETEGDYLNTEFFKSTVKYAGSNDYQYGALRFIDEVLRTQIAIAQLIKDGVYEAYDEEGNYNPKKDKRFNGEEGIAYKNALLESLKKSDFIDQDSTEPNIPYTIQDLYSIKSTVGKYIIGGMTEREVPFFFDSVAGQVVGVFKRHLPTIWSRAFAGETMSSAFSKLKTLKNEDGEIVSDVAVHNYMGAMASVGKTLKDYKLIYDKGLKEYVNTMSEAQKTGLKQTMSSALMYGALFSFVSALASMGFDDEKKHYHSAWALKRLEFIYKDTLSSIWAINMIDEIFQTPFIFDKIKLLLEGDVNRALTSNSFGAWYDLLTEEGKR